MKGNSQMTGSIASFVSLTILVFLPILSSASGILYQFNTPFPTDPSPSGSTPWLTADFENTSSGVDLTISSAGLQGSEFINGNGNGANGGVFFNLNPADNPTSLAFALVSSSGSFAPQVSTGEDSFKADGDGKYDVQIDFGNNFSAGNSITYLITGISGLTAADFSYLSAESGGESGPFYAAAHIQGLSGGNSTWIEPGGGPMTTPVPEPSTVAFLAVSIILLGVFRLRTSKV
jgi:hypothetical protein